MMFVVYFHNNCDPEFSKYVRGATRSRWRHLLVRGKVYLTVCVLKTRLIYTTVHLMLIQNLKKKVPE